MASCLGTGGHQEGGIGRGGFEGNVYLPAETRRGRGDKKEEEEGVSMETRSLVNLREGKRRSPGRGSGGGGERDEPAVQNHPRQTNEASLPYWEGHHLVLHTYEQTTPNISAGQRSSQISATIANALSPRQPP
jgi:hypothetical protein